MTVAVTSLLGSKGLKPLVTPTDFATLTQSIKPVTLLGFVNGSGPNGQLLNSSGKLKFLILST